MKYKDIRMLIFTAVILIVCIFGIVCFIHELLKVLLLSLFIVTLLPMVLLSYSSKIFDDSLLIYTFRKVAILPLFISFKDLKSFKKVSSYKIKIVHNKVSYIYILQSDEFIKELTDKYNKFKNMNE